MLKVNKLSKKNFSIIKKHGQPNVFLLVVTQNKIGNQKQFQKTLAKSFEKNVKIQLNSSCWVICRNYGKED